MARTNKRYPWSYYRKFRNRKQALQARYENPPIRKGAIPPDPWDDYYNDQQAWLPTKLAGRMFDEGEPLEKIAAFLRRRGYPALAIKKIVDDLNLVAERRGRYDWLLD